MAESIEQLARRVWADDEDAAEWMRTRHPELDGTAPKDAEPERVRALLMRLYFGIPS